MKKLAFIALFALGGCPDKTDAPPKKVENNNPYKNVTPQRVKEQVEATQKKEEERNDQIVDKALKE